MNVEVVGRNFEVTDRLRQLTETRLEKKVLKFLEEPVEIRVTLEGEKHHQSVADIHVTHRHGVLQATEATDDMVEAITLAVEKVVTQAGRTRKKSKDRKRRVELSNGLKWPVDVIEAASVSHNGGPRIIKSTHLAIKPMTIEEAALSLDGAKNDFVVFRDSTSDQVSVLYKRRDEHFGLIVPEA